MSFKISSLALAVATLSTISVAHAAGLDRSTQPSSVFTEQGTFAYIEGISIDPKITGKDNKDIATTADKYQEDKDISDMGEKYQYINYGAKGDVNDTVSLGVFFDQPWGADVEYSGDNNFVGAPTAVISANTANVYASATQLLQATNPNAPAVSSATAYNAAVTNVQNAINYLNSTGQTARATALNDGLTKLQTGAATANFVNSNLSKVTGGTNVRISSQNFTGVMGIKLGEKKNIQIYGGPTLQKLGGDVHLRGNAYRTLSGYDANVIRDTAYGWMAGVAYLKPEIALKAALTYRSEIDHETDMFENVPATGKQGTNEVTITTPKSVNFDFQTGLNPTTLLTAKARWVPWSDFAIKPKMYGDATKLAKDTNGNSLYPNGLNLVSYDKDAWSGEVGIGKKLSPQLALSGSVGYDSGAGNPVSSLGPVDGYWNVGLGARYNLTPEWAISGGAKYLMFGDAKAKLPDGSIVGDFKDNDGWIYGLRLSYQKK